MRAGQIRWQRNDYSLREMVRIMRSPRFILDEPKEALHFFGLLNASAAKEVCEQDKLDSSERKRTKFRVWHPVGPSLPENLRSTVA